LWNLFNELILPVEYDDVFCVMQIYSKNIVKHYYVVHLNGKVGMLMVTLDNRGRTINAELVVNIECDSVTIFGAPVFINLLLLKDDNGQRYYNMDTEKMSDYYNSIYADVKEKSNILRAYKDGRHYLIDPCNDNVLFDIYTGRDYWAVSNIGSDNFINIDNNWIFVKDENKLKALTEYNVVAPLSIYPFPLINHINIVNAIKGENGLGVLDNVGDVLIEPEYDEITYEVRLSAIKGSRTIEKNIPIVQINKDTELSNWHEKIIP